MRSGIIRRQAARGMLALAAIVPMAAQPVVAGVFDDDEARKAILDLRARTDADRADFNNRLEQAQRAELDLANQIDGLRQDLAKLRGEIEVLTNQISNEEKRQKDFYTDLDTRLRKLEPQQATIDGRTGEVDQNESRAFDAALALFKSSDFKGSIAAFQAFQQRYPDSLYAPAAQYWIGTSFYAQRDYKTAISAQQTVVKNWPDSPRAADALLNIASAQTDMGDKKAARKTLESLISSYPDSQAAGVAKDRLVSLR